jgi:NADPH2:quinone reductase
MKAIRVHEFGGPEVMKLESVPDVKPGEGQVIVRVHAAGVNPVDTYIRAGVYPKKPALPYTPGTDSAGTVESVGAGVKSVKAGDRVYTAGSLTGAYAEQTLCAEAQVHPLPANVTFAQGAAIGVPFATAFRGLFQMAKAIPAERVLVHGASGSVGLAAVQLGRAAGMEIFGTAGTDKGRKLASDNGAHHVLDHTKPGYLDELMQLTGGRGVDVVLEMLANVNLGKDLTVLAPKGRVVVIGSRGPVEINPRDAMTRDASIHAMSLWNATDSDLRSIHAALVAGLGDGTLRPVIRQEFSLAEAPRAHVAVMEPGAYGKIVLTIG